MQAEELARTLRVWGPLFAADLDSDTSLYTSSTDVPDDLIATAKRFASTIRTIEDSSKPSYSAQGIEAIDQATARAEVALRQGREATATAEATAQAVRDTAVVCAGTLILLRRVLRPVLGRGHADYRSLRRRLRASTNDGEAVAEAAAPYAPDPSADVTRPEPPGDDQPSGDFDLEVAAE